MARASSARFIRLTPKESADLHSIAESARVIADCFSSTKSFMAKWVPVIAVAFAVFYPTISKVITQVAQSAGVIQ